MIRHSPRLPLRPILIACSACLLIGCSSLPSASDGRSESLIDRQGVDVVAADAGRQLTYFKDQGSQERFCHTPPPDFSRTAGSGTSVGLPTLAGGTAGIGSNLSKGSIDLGGRDPIVLISRELLYRACELATNTNADPATEREIYNKFLATLIEIAKSHTGQGAAPLASEPAPAAPVSATPNVPKVKNSRANPAYPSTDPY